MESHASPDLLTVCQPRNGMRFLYGPNAATDGKSAGSGFAPRGGKDPTILGLILSRPFVTATDVEIGSVGGNVRSSRASSETSPRERTFVPSI